MPTVCLTFLISRNVLPKLTSPRFLLPTSRRSRHSVASSTSSTRHGRHLRRQWIGSMHSFCASWRLKNRITSGSRGALYTPLASLFGRAAPHQNPCQSPSTLSLLKIQPQLSSYWSQRCAHVRPGWPPSVPRCLAP